MINQFFKIFFILTLIINFLCEDSLAEDRTFLSVPLNRPITLNLPDGATKVIVIDKRIANVVNRQGRAPSITGRREGSTEIRFLDKAGRLKGVAKVTVIADLPEIKRLINSLFPTENIGVNYVNDSIALSGFVSDAQTADQIISVAEEFVSKNNSKLTNHTPRVLNLMKMRSGQQVMLRVRIGEIKRSALKQLGVNLQGETNHKLSFPFETNNTVNQAFNTANAATNSFGMLGMLYNTTKLKLSATLDMLERDGLFKILAEPNIVAISGEKAEFLAGGEFPIPITQENNDVISVTFKKFGVGVEFTPNVLSQNRIRLEVEPEVSEVTRDTSEGAVEISGFSIPSLISRKAKTTVELAPGESFMIAGLIKDDLRTTINEIPGLANIPVLSALFRSTSFQRDETELVIAVTPYLVDPITPADIRLPSDNFAAPSWLDMIFLGALSNSKDQSNVLTQSGDLEGPMGFMLD